VTLIKLLRHGRKVKFSSKTILFILLFLQLILPIAYSDRHSTGGLTDDQAIIVSLSEWENNDSKLKNAHIKWSVFDRVVLVTGEVPSRRLRNYIAKQISAINPRINRVINETVVKSNSDIFSKMKDSAIEAQVEALYQDQNTFQANHVRVISTNQTVFLMGKVTKKEGNKAVKIAAKVKGVKKIIKLFHYLKHQPVDAVLYDQNSFAKHSDNLIDYAYLKTKVIDPGLCGGFATKDGPGWVASCIAKHYLIGKGDYKNALLWYLETNKFKPEWNLNNYMAKIKDKLGSDKFFKIKQQYSSGEISLKDVRLWAFKDIKSSVDTRVVDKVELKFSDELNKDIASSDAKSELKEKPLYSKKRADFRYVMRDDTKLRDNDGFSDNVIKLLKKGTMVWLKNGGNNSTGLIPVRVDRKTWGYVLKATLSEAKPKEFFSANPTNSEFDNDDSFSGLWGKYGGSVLDSKGSLKQQSNYASNTSVDTKAPIISLNQDNLTTVDSSNFNLSGFVKDDSSVSEVSINGGLIAINSSGQFDMAMYLGLGKNKFIIEAIDIFGNKASKSITVVRNKAIVKNIDKKLTPPTTQLASNPNSIALIIGLDDYKSMPNAPWAESDASTFYDYARNALGIPVERIRLITGQESDRTAIWKSLEQWLPSQVDKNKSNVYVYFAGHGLASEDGKDAYLMPYDGDTSMLSRTAIPRKDVISGLDSLKARSVTLFMDTCYSGSAKGGKQTLVASRGLRIVKKDALSDLPSNFTLFSAAANDETAISHPTRKNGLFSYWMMRGLEGEADSNNDDKLTNGELHAFISDKVQKTAIAKGHNQHPQLVGDKDKVIASW
jgi:osmotically-inducible protein OsmY